jgi:hypothetical protein
MNETTTDHSADDATEDAVETQHSILDISIQLAEGGALKIEAIADRRIPEQLVETMICGVFSRLLARIPNADTHITRLDFPGATTGDKPQH